MIFLFFGTSHEGIDDCDDDDNDDSVDDDGHDNDDCDPLSVLSCLSVSGSDIDVLSPHALALDTSVLCVLQERYPLVLHLSQH